MALTETQTTLFTEARYRLGGIFALIAKGFDALADILARSSLIESLYRKTDAELAQLGLKREDIPRHVFKDMLDS